VSSAALGVAGTDYRPSEVMVALFVSLGVVVWTVVLLKLSQLALMADAPAIAPSDPVAVKVNPVLDMDSPLLKLGGNVRVKMPNEWEQHPDVVKRRAQVSTKAGQTADDIPDKDDLEVSDAGTPIDPSATVTDDPIDENLSDAGAEGSGGGSPEGSEHGTETDPLKARAASQYHGRILGFLKSGFACPGPASCTPSASVSIGGGGAVTGFSFNACGDAAIDSAARASIASKVGQAIPPPPENYPELRPNSFSVAYVCK
jgi:hypothetical protein